MKPLLLSVIIMISFIAALMIIRVKPFEVVFGQYAGECSGNCGTIYKVTSKVLVIDTSSFWESRDAVEVKWQKYLEEDHEGDFNRYIINVPLLLICDPRIRFGCPDYWDQGRYYFEFTIFDIRRRYEIDAYHVPFYYKYLIKEVDNNSKEIDKELNLSRK